MVGLEPENHDVTAILSALGDGDDSAAERLFPLVYEELRALAGRYIRPHAADPEAYLMSIRLAHAAGRAQVVAQGLRAAYHRDGVHPNAQGYQAWADLIRERVVGANAKPAP